SANSAARASTGFSSADESFFIAGLPRAGQTGGAHVALTMVVLSPRVGVNEPGYGRSFVGPVEQARHTFQDGLEPCHCTDVAVAGGRLGQAEHLGDLGVAQLLEVTQGDDLAVDRVHAVERLLEP